MKNLSIVTMLFCLFIVGSLQSITGEFNSDDAHSISHLENKSSSQSINNTSKKDIKLFNHYYPVIIPTNKINHLYHDQVVNSILLFRLFLTTVFYDGGYLSASYRSLI